MRKMIVVDDNAEIAEQTVTGLIAHLPSMTTKFEVLSAVAHTVDGAVNAILEAKAEDVVLDIQLSRDGTEGVEVARRLKESGFSGRIIAHSAMPKAEQQKLLVPQGVSHFAEKQCIDEIIHCFLGCCRCDSAELPVAYKSATDFLIFAPKPTGDAIARMVQATGIGSAEVCSDPRTMGAAIWNSKPQVVIYDADERFRYGASHNSIMHDWNITRENVADAPANPDFSEITFVMLGTGSMHQDEAAKRSHLYHSLIYQLREFSDWLKSLL